MKKKILTAIQVLIGIGLLIFLFSKMDSHEIISAVKATGNHWPLLILASMCFPIALAIVSVRWRILLKAQSINTSYIQVYILTFIGHFFNVLIPGATGGDILKAYYATRETPDKKAEAVTTVVVDRIIGLLSLIIFCVTVMCIRFQFFMTYKETKQAFFFYILLLIGTLGGLVLVFGQSIFEKWSLFKKLEEKTKIGEILHRIYNAFRICFTRPDVFFKALWLSFVNQIILIACGIFLGKALELNMHLIDYISLLPVINTITAIPLTPGGIGVREAASIYLLGVVGVPEFKAFLHSNMTYISTMLIWSGVGGMIYFYYIYRTTRKNP